MLAYLLADLGKVIGQYNSMPQTYACFAERMNAEKQSL